MVHKKLKISLLILAIIVLFRLALPSITKFALNRYFESFSPSIAVHIADVKMAIVKGSYTLEGVKAWIKKTNKEFLEVRSVNASVSWSDLFKGHITTNILIKKAQLNATPSLLPALKEHVASMDKTKKSKETRISIPRVDLVDSLIRMDHSPVARNLDARITNVIPSKNSPLSPFNIKGSIIGGGKMKVEGELNLYAKKPQWSIDSEILNFDMTALNPFLIKKLPLTFTKGELDLYAEAKSENGPIVGYMKPFIKGLDVLKSDEKMLGPKHWLIEIISALGDTTLKADEVVATKIPFTYDKKFKVGTGETIEKAIENGFVQKQSRGIENSIDLKQSQEEK